MDEIINQVKNTWSKDLIIRFLYIKLAPFVKRDLQYFLASDEERLQQYSLGFINRFPDIVCSTLADYYVELFNGFGINAKKVIATSSKIPLFAVIVEGDYGFYFLDPLNDLFSNQYGLRPYFFGVIPRYRTLRANHPEITQLEKEYVSELDEELNIKYLNEYFKALEPILKNRQRAREFFGYDKNENIDLKERKYKFINDRFINLGSVSGSFERALMYKYLSERLLNHTERRFTTTTLTGGLSNPHVEIEIKTKEGVILLEEEKQDNKYLLIKK